MSAEILLTLKLHDQLFADPRRIHLLKQIVRTGSISQAAKEAGISYKTAWDAINEMNHISEYLLVERSVGGKGGGGASLTAYGQRFVQLYDLLQQIQQRAFDVLQDASIPLDSLLASIARFSLQTSARNQFMATIEQIAAQDIMVILVLKLANSQARLKAVVTHQSIERLGLVPGKEVIALIKAPWITLSTTPQKEFVDNELSGRISSIQTAKYHNEIILNLGDELQLCAACPVDNSEDYQIGQVVYANFSAESIIIATLV